MEQTEKEFSVFYPSIQDREILTPGQEQETASVDPEVLLLADLGYVKILQVWNKLGKKKSVRGLKVQVILVESSWRPVEYNDFYFADNLLSALLYLLCHFFTL